MFYAGAMQFYAVQNCQMIHVVTSNFENCKVMVEVRGRIHLMSHKVDITIERIINWY